MASTYVNNLRLNEMGTGDASGTWGTTTNTNLELIGEALGFGTEAITTNADTHSTVVADGASDAGRAMYLKYTGTLDSACTITITPNTMKRMQFIENGTSGSQNIIISQGSGANITIPPGDVKAVYLDGAGSGAAVVDAFASLNVVDLKVQDDLTVTDDLIVNGDIDLEGAIDVNGTANLDVVDIDGAVDMASTLQVDGVATFTGRDIHNGGITIANAGQIGSVGDTDAIAIASDGVVTLTQKLVGTELDISGNVDVDGTLETDALSIASTTITATAAELNLLDGVSGLVQADLTKLAAVDSTAAELNIVDGGTSATSTTLVDADRVVVNDNGTMVQVAMTDVKTYIGGGTSWQAVKTGNYTASAGEGVFANTTSTAWTLTLPAGSIGDEVSFIDYAGTFDSNALTIAANGSEKINGSTADLTVSVERAANTLVYTDGTQGWLLKNK